jgi:lipooligosaccharide transport system ATP-binding protein
VIKRYGKITAVDGVSFHVRRGETYGLLGPNGAGKTSTMRMLSAVSPLSGGEMTVAGLDVARQGREVRQVLGVVTQKDGLDSDLTVRQNLEIYGYLSGLSSGASRARAAEVLEFFGLSDRAGGDVDELSGGMKRRLAIARAFMPRPRVMVLDEPTTGLDPQSRNRVWEQLTVLKLSGVTVLMSTHYMEEAATLCDRVAIMDHGRILDEGAPDELVARRAGSEVAQVRASAATRQAVLASLRGAGYQCVEVGALINVTSQNGERPDPGPAALNGARVSYRSANLEDVFLALTGRELRDE